MRTLNKEELKFIANRVNDSRARAKDKKMNGITESHSFTMTNPTQGNSDTNNTRSHILTGTDGQYAAGDAIAISMQWGTTGPTNTADRIYVSEVLENDWKTVSY